MSRIGLGRRAVGAAIAWSLLVVQVSGADWASELFETRRHDFGTVARAAKTEYEFEFVNNTNQELHISHVRASCGCTTPIIPERTIAPGAAGSIIARFNTRSFLGKRGATLTVVFDRPSYREVQLRVDGYVRRDVVCNPGAIEFGKLQMSERAHQEIDIQYAGRNDWAIEEVQADIPGIEFNLQETRRGGGRVGYKLVAEWDPKQAGYLQSEVVLRTNDRRRPTIPLELSAQVAAALQVSPSQIYLGRMQPGESVSKRVILRSGEAFSIERFEASDARIKLTCPEQAKPLQVVELVFVAEGEPGPFEAEVVIETTAGDQANATLHVTGEIATEVADAEQ